MARRDEAGKDNLAASLRRVLATKQPDEMALQRYDMVRPDGGTITVRACEQGDMLRVEVCDTGIGIPPAQQSLIFQPFTQVDMSNTRAAGGVGLGLSIVKGLVEAHGGQVGVESDGHNEVSTFWFTLPLVAG